MQSSAYDTSVSGNLTSACPDTKRKFRQMEGGRSNEHLRNGNNQETDEYKIPFCIISVQFFAGDISLIV